MNLLNKINSRLYAPQITRTRMVVAVIVAVAADALQLIQVPGFIEVVDVVAVIATIWLLGFHLLLLPTFIVEFVPVVDMLPTWTGCVIAVIALRKRGPEAAPPTTDLPPSSHD